MGGSGYRVVRSGPVARLLTIAEHLSLARRTNARRDPARGSGGAGALGGGGNFKGSDDHPRLTSSGASLSSCEGSAGTPSARHNHMPFDRLI